MILWEKSFTGLNRKPNLPTFLITPYNTLIYNNQPYPSLPPLYSPPLPRGLPSPIHTWCIWKPWWPGVSPVRLPTTVTGAPGPPDWRVGEEEEVEEEEEKEKVLTKGEVLWQKELEVAMYDPRIRRCSVTVGNLPNSVLRPYVEIARRNMEGKEGKVRREVIVRERREQQRRNRKVLGKKRKQGKEVTVENLEHEYSSDREAKKYKGKQLDVEDTDNENVDFSNVLNSTAIDHESEIEIEKIIQPVDLIPHTSAAVKQKTNKPNDVKPPALNQSLEKSDIQFVEARKVECPDCAKTFTARAKLLGHLTTHHYSSQLLQLHPFTKGPCPLCLSSGRTKAFTIKDKSNHLRHLGQAHEAVLAVARDEVKDIVAMFARATRRRTSISREAIMDTSGDGINTSRDGMDTSRDGMDTSSRDGMDITIKSEPVDTEELEMPIIDTEPVEMKEEPAMNVFQELDNMLAEPDSKSIKENQSEETKPKVIQATNEYKEDCGLTCLSCNLKFISREALESHNVEYQKVHSKVYTCKYCTATAIGTRNFKEHLVSHKSQTKTRLSQ